MPTEETRQGGAVRSLAVAHVPDRSQAVFLTRFIVTIISYKQIIMAENVSN